MAKKTTNTTKKAATKIKETKKTVTKKATQAKATVKSAKDKTVEAVKDTAKDVKQEVENKVEQNVEDAKDQAKKGTSKVKNTIEAIKKDEIIINPFAYVFAYGYIGVYKASDAISTGIKNIGDKIKSGKKEKVTA